MKGVFTLQAIDGTARRLTRRARERLAGLGFAPRANVDNEQRLRCVDLPHRPNARGLRHHLPIPFLPQDRSQAAAATAPGAVLGRYCIHGARAGSSDGVRAFVRMKRKSR